MGEEFFRLFHSTITFLAVYGFYVKVVKRLTYTDNNSKFNERSNFTVTLKKTKAFRNKKDILFYILAVRTGVPAYTDAPHSCGQQYFNSSV